MRVFVLEDDPERMRHFRSAFMAAAIDHAESCADIGAFKPPYDAVFLDHDLGGRQMVEHEDSGTTFCHLLVEGGLLTPADKVIVHSYNGTAAIRMLGILADAGIVARYAPFAGPGFEDIVSEIVV